MTKLLSMLSDSNIIAKDSTVSGALLLVYSVARGNLAGSFVIVIVALALALATTYSISRNRKIYALKELRGYRWTNNVRTEIASATRTFSAGVVGLLVVGMPALAIYNGFQQAPRFLGILVLSVAVLYIVVIALVALAMLTLPRLEIPTVLKGEQAFIRNGVLAACALVAVMAIVVATSSVAMNRVEAIRGTLAISSSWTKSNDLFALRLSTSGTHQDDLRDAPGFAAAVLTLENAGEMLLAGYQGDIAEEGVGEPSDPSNADSMIVNHEYLRRQVVNDSDGRRIIDLPTGKDRFTLLIPRSYDGDPSALLQRYVEYFRDFACISGPPEGSFSCDPKGTIVFTAPGQTLFSYNGTEVLPAEMGGRCSLRLFQA